MPTPDQISEATQALLAVSTFGLLVVAGLGLRQLGLAKKGLQQSADLARTAAKREAYKLAADQCSKYMEEIVPLMDKCDHELNDLGVSELLQSFSVKVHKSGIYVSPPKELPKAIAKKLQGNEVVLSVLPVHNALETFAVMFTTGVAAEEGAFSSVGSSFCYNVRKHVPLILPYAGSPGYPGTGHYQNALQLFMSWQQRIDQQELLAKKESLSKQLSESHDIKIPPIGT